jgi:hypothetical protein
MTNPQYLVNHDGQIQGPFDLPFIEAMILAGVYPAAVLIKGLQAEGFTPMQQEGALAGDKPQRPTPTGAPPARAAEVTATLEPKSVPAGEGANLTITITNGTPTVANKPEVPGLIIQGPNQGRQYSKFNGVVSCTVTLSYAIGSMTAGQYTIPPFTIIVDGSEVKTDTFTLTVTSSAATPPARAAAPSPAATAMPSEMEHWFLASPGYRRKGTAAPSPAATGSPGGGEPKSMGWEAQLGWVIGIMSAVFLIAVIFNDTGIGLSQRRTGGADPPQRKSPVQTQTNREAEKQESPSSTVTTFNPPPPVSTPPPPAAVAILPPPKLVDDTTLYRDASGRTYRVPNAAYSRLLSKKAALDAQKPEMDRQQAAINARAAEIDRDRLSLNRRNQNSVDLFNQKVNRFNDANTRLQSAVDSYNLGVNAFNDELARVGTLIR